MAARKEILGILEKHKGKYYSGEKLAEELNISRAAVWKAIRQLRDDGYLIDAATNKGYCLSEHIDLLREQGIWKYLGPACQMLDLQVIPSVGSTNALLRQKAEAGSPEGTVLIAGMQTDGKGRLGRRFYSPSNTGVYLSLLLRPVQIAAELALRLTTMAAAAACEAIDAVSGKQTQIKWVNDIYLENRKVAGILTEGSVSMETGSMDTVILGIGINVYPPEGGFPGEIRETAGAVLAETTEDGKNRIAAGFLNRFISYYLSGDFSAYVQTYRKRCFVIGKEILVRTAASERKALALDIDEDCRLVVRYEDGSEDRLNAGEISIKM